MIQQRFFFSTRRRGKLISASYARRKKFLPISENFTFCLRRSRWKINVMKVKQCSHTTKCHFLKFSMFTPGNAFVFKTQCSHTRNCFFFESFDVHTPENYFFSKFNVHLPENAFFKTFQCPHTRKTIVKIQCSHTRRCNFLNF